MSEKNLIVCDVCGHEEARHWVEGGVPDDWFTMALTTRNERFRARSYPHICSPKCLEKALGELHQTVAEATTRLIRAR